MRTEVASRPVDVERADRRAGSAPWVSYAQNFEDVFLRRCFAECEYGFWIDVGAWMPREDSVTYALSERGWRGINIEPVPDHLAAFVEQRPRDINLGVLAGSAAGQRTLHRVADTGLSTTIEAFAEEARRDGHAVESSTIEVRTLDDIWDQYVPPGTTVNLLKVDAEGAETDVLAGLDLRRRRPWLLCIEANLPNERDLVDVAWEPAVIAAGYAFAFYDGLNRWFVADEQRELARHFASPVCVFDDVIGARANDHIDMLAAEAHRLAQEVARLERELRECKSAAESAPMVRRGWRSRFRR